MGTGIALALTQIIIPLLPTITTGVESLLAFINSTKAVAQQSGEWTDAMDAAFLAAQQAMSSAPEQQPDKK